MEGRVSGYLVHSQIQFVQQLETMAVKLSVNVNKIATLRNSRGGNNPDLIQVARDCERFGADGITVHPRPDQRHIRYDDVPALKEIITTEFNIEGNPKESSFVELVLQTRPTQVTLVPDAPGQLTSNHGWDTIGERKFLQDIIPVFRNAGIRVSIFVDPVEELVAAAKDTGTDRVELYTEAYARTFPNDAEAAISAYRKAAQVAIRSGLGLNAGHDLDLRNLSFFAKNIGGLQEVSIGHALICDAIYYGLENTVSMYKRCLSDS